jgi:hypothetical protein
VLVSIHEKTPVASGRTSLVRKPGRVMRSHAD